MPVLKFALKIKFVTSKLSLLHLPQFATWPESLLATGLAMPWECSSASDGVGGAVHQQRCQAALFGQKRTCCGEDLRWLHELVMLADKYISPAQLWLRFESP